MVIPFWPPLVVTPHPFWCQLWLESELESSPLGLGGLCLFVCLFVCIVVSSIPLVLMLLSAEYVLLLLLSLLLLPLGSCLSCLSGWKLLQWVLVLE